MTTGTGNLTGLFWRERAGRLPCFLSNSSYTDWAQVEASDSTYSRTHLSTAIIPTRHPHTVTKGIVLPEQPLRQQEQHRSQEQHHPATHALEGRPL